MRDDAVREHDESRAASVDVGASVAETHELLFAMCHEIGNLVTAVQFEADRLGEAESPRGLAASALKIEDLCAQVGGLLSQVRPLLADSPPLARKVDPAAIVTAAKEQLDWRGTGSVVVAVDLEPDLPKVDIDPDSTRDLLLGIAHATLDARPGCKRVELEARAVAGGVALCVIDDGPEEEALADWKSRAPCGRPLLCALADRILRRAGGSMEVSREAGRTRIALKLPAGCERH